MATKWVLHTLAPATIEEATSQRQSIRADVPSRARPSRLRAVKHPRAQTAAASRTSAMLCSPVIQLRTFIMITIQHCADEGSVNAAISDTYESVSPMRTRYG